MAIIPLAGGDGALTQRNGILVVDDVTGQTTAPGAFALVAPVFAGPYEYGLFRGSVDASNAQAWYLRSSLDCTGPTPPNVCPVPPDPPTPTPTPAPPTPNYRPEVSLYAALPALALRYGRALLGTLHERVGDQDLLRGRDDFDDGDVLNGAWMRVIGLHGNADGDRVGIYGEEGPQYDFDLIALQGGVDVYRAQDMDGRRNHAGVGLAHGRIKGDVTHVVDGRRAGKNEIEGTTLSAYWTHYGRGGGYLDAVLQGTWFDADAISTRGVKLRTDEGGFGWGASLEAGLPWRRGVWTIEPQAQVIYQSIDDLTGRDVGARVRFDDGDSLAARVGVRFARTLELAAAPDGTSRAVTGWLRLNYWHEFEAQPRTSFSSQSGDVPFTSDLTGGWGQVNLGVSAQLGRNASIYANLNYENGLGGRYDAWDGSVGFRWNW
jgi:outer membrane autotransporter protein